SSYFDTIPHHELMQSVARRVSDGAMLALIKSWLEMAVEEEDGKGNKQRRTVNKDSGRGTPQGAPISPLLANLYMRRFLLRCKTLGWDEKLQARIVKYADDFVSRMNYWVIRWGAATAQRPEGPISEPNPLRNGWPDCVRRSVK